MLAKRASRLFAILVAFSCGSASAAEGEGLEWRSNLPGAQREAHQRQKLVLLHFGSESCGPCRRLEANVFSLPGFGAELSEHYVAVKLDADRFPSTAKMYGVKTVPVDIITTPDGAVIERLTSPQSAEAYVGAMLKIAQDFKSDSKDASAIARDDGKADIRRRNRYSDSYVDPRQSGPDTRVAPSKAAADGDASWRGLTEEEQRRARSDDLQKRTAGRFGHLRDQMDIDDAPPPSLEEQVAELEAQNADPEGVGANRLADQKRRTRGRGAQAKAPQPKIARNDDDADEPSSDRDDADNGLDRRDADGPHGRQLVQNPRTKPKTEAGEKNRYGRRAELEPGRTDRRPTVNETVAQFRDDAEAAEVQAAEHQANVQASEPEAGSRFAKGRRDDPPAADRTARGSRGVAGVRDSRNTASTTHRDDMADRLTPAQQRTQVANGPTPEIDPSNPPLALEGYSSVAVFENREWVRGDVRWGAIHRGRTYLFADQGEQERFLANPDAFSPVISGNDPVLAVDSNLNVAGRRNYGCKFDGRMYLFASEANYNKFNANPTRYIAGLIASAQKTKRR